MLDADPSDAACRVSSTIARSCRSCWTCWPSPPSRPDRPCSGAGCERRGRPACRSRRCCAATSAPSRMRWPTSPIADSCSGAGADARPAVAQAAPALRRMRRPGRRLQLALPRVLRHQHHRAVAGRRRRLPGDARSRPRRRRGRGAAAVPGPRPGSTRSSRSRSASRIWATRASPPSTGSATKARRSSRGRWCTCSSTARRSPRRRSPTGCATG